MTEKEIAGAPVQPLGAVYSPPPVSACRPAVFFVPLAAENRLACHQRIYKKRIVHFSIEHQYWWDGKWVPVARIDTSRSVHLHLFDRYGSSLIDHRVLVELPPSPDGQQVVHNCWEDAFLRLEHDWEEHLRRWSE